MGDALSARERGVARWFDRCAANGDLAGFEPDERPKVQKLLSRWRLAPGERVLEVGCGSGRLSELLLPRVSPGGMVAAFDVSLAMLAVARRRCAGGAALVRASVSRLPWPGGCFDRAMLFCVLPHLADPAAAFVEIARVLRVGGEVWVDHLADRTAVNAFHRALGGEVADHLIPPEPVLLDWMELAGLDVLELGDGPAGFRARARRPG